MQKDPQLANNVNLKFYPKTSGKFGTDFAATTGATSSGLDRSSTIEQSSPFNLKNIQEEEKSLPDVQGTGAVSDVLSEENQVRIKSMMPKTATNFSKMKKGLYLNPLKGYPYNHKDEALARSLNILQAYGEIIPAISQQQKRRKSRASSKKMQTRRSLLNDSNTYNQNQSSGQGYMNVIRESPIIVNQREKLERQKREILNMQFDVNCKKKDDNKELNQYLSERYTQDSKDEISDHTKRNQSFDLQKI